MTMERTSSRHAQSRAHLAYECTECGYIVQMSLREPTASVPKWCPRCKGQKRTEGGQ